MVEYDKIWEKTIARMRKIRLSVIIIARDEEENIKDCLESVKWADEIVVVVDDRSIDKTAQITQKYTPKVYQHRLETLGKQKQYALGKAKGDWILSIDADEQVTPPLRKEIEKAIESKKYSGYHLFFQEVFLGKRLAVFGKIQGSQRVFKKDKAKFTEDRIHERVIIEGDIGQLNNPILHYSHRTISQTLDKFNRHSSFEAEEIFEEGGRTNLFYIFLAPTVAFFRQYVKWRSYRYGFHGIIMAILASIYYLMKHLKLWEMQERSKDKRKK